MLYAILKRTVVVLTRLLFRLETRGTEHVPMHGPVLLVANHSSLLDPPLVGGMAPRPLTFMAKAELFRLPLFGWLIHELNARPVKREGADVAALRAALRALGEGAALLVFPEGTRGPEGTLRPPRPGAALLAVMSGAPVVPVLVTGSGRAWPRGAWLPRPAKVVVSFGPALTFARPSGTQRKREYEAIGRQMMAAIGRLRDDGGARVVAPPHSLQNY